MSQAKINYKQDGSFEVIKAGYVDIEAVIEEASRKSGVMKYPIKPHLFLEVLTSLHSGHRWLYVQSRQRAPCVMTSEKYDDEIASTEYVRAYHFRDNETVSVDRLAELVQKLTLESKIVRENARTLRMMTARKGRAA